jgi:hypothetical protein
LTSILEKSEVAPESTVELLEGIDWEQLADAEDVLLTMAEFGPGVLRAAEQSEPSVITNLMIRLAGSIHAYLKEHHVLRAEPRVRAPRLALVAGASSRSRSRSRSGPSRSPSSPWPIGALPPPDRAARPALRASTPTSVGLQPRRAAGGTILPARGRSTARRLRSSSKARSATATAGRSERSS